MADVRQPFRFDLRELVDKARRRVAGSVEGVSVSLPGISLSINPDDLEKRVAREIVIRLADRRVLNATECCDTCISQALDSLQSIRQILVDKRVELAKLEESPLSIVIEAMLIGIRQFLTFQQQLDRLRPAMTEEASSPGGILRDTDDLGRRDVYFAALEMLRAHLYRCLEQVAEVAGIGVPGIPEHMRYSTEWQLSAYEALNP